jgi:hypothetical protein
MGVLDISTWVTQMDSNFNKFDPTRKEKGMQRKLPPQKLYSTNKSKSKSKSK